MSGIDHIEDAIENHEFRVKYTWDNWYWREVPKDVDIPGLGVVNIEKIGSDEYEVRFIILRVDQPDGVTRYFKKDGNSSSFTVEMTGSFTEVFPTTRTIKEFK